MTSPGALPRAARGGTAGRLVLLGPHPPPWGGISVHVRALRALARREGIAVEVLDVGEGRGAGGQGVRDAGSYPRFVAELVRARARGGVLHAHVPGNNRKAWLVALAASRALPGGLLTVHSGLSPALLDASRDCRTIARLACAGHARTLCANDAIAAALARSGVEPRRLEVLPAYVPGADRPSRPPAAAQAARARHGELLVAALAPGRQYGEEVLLGGLELLCRSRAALGCVLYGPGTDRAALQDAIGRRGLFGRVTPLGPLDHAASLAVLRLADAFVRPTLADGDSISVREALGLGVRVVASDVGRRPPGAIVFRPGDPRDLAARVELALASPPPAPGAGAADVEARLLCAWAELGIGRPPAAFDPPKEGALP